MRKLMGQFLVLLSLLVAGDQSVTAQERFLVGTSGAFFGLYDLATNSLIEEVRAASAITVLPGPNNRLAFSISDAYVSVVDLTIGREIKRIQGIGRAESAALTSDGKLLIVVEEDSNLLDFVDTARLQIVRKLSLASTGPGFPFGIVVSTNVAYILSSDGAGNPKIVIVNLSTYATSSIALPPGYFNGRQNIALTADGSTLIAVEYANGNMHVLLISTTTNAIFSDKAQNGFSNAYGVATTAADGNHGYVIVRGNNQAVAVPLDLRTNSQTYGQLLTSNAVSLGSGFNPAGLAINSDASRLLVSGRSDNGPQAGPNLDVIDVAKMFSDPARAVLSQLIINGGVWTHVAIGFFSTTPPNTAPVVNSVSGDITNDAPHDIQITGGNFQQGALVRIGSMDPLPATVTGNSMLSVTVPANAAAGKAVDIVVTNPLTQAPQEQQNQSGLFAAAFNIRLNPLFQPTTQFASTNGSNEIAVYDLIQRTTVNLQPPPAYVMIWPSFNVNGRELYVTYGRASDFTYQVLPINLSNNQAASPISFSDSNITFEQTLTPALDPISGKPVAYVPYGDIYGTDLYVAVLDTDPGSANFNTVVKVLPAGLSPNFYEPDGFQVTPDGHYAYIWYDDLSYFYLGIMNLTTGAFSSYPFRDLGISPDQFQFIYLQWVSISPDGKWLIMPDMVGSRSYLKMFDISSRALPKLIATLAPVPVPGHGFPQMNKYQVVGSKLYGIDLNGIVVVFNFHPEKGDVRELGYYVSNSPFGGYAFSIDGAYMYVTDEARDQITVLKSALLASGKDAVLTNLRAPFFPRQLAVSPVPPPANAQVGSGHHAGVEVRSGARAGVAPASNH